MDEALAHAVGRRVRAARTCVHTGEPEMMAGFVVGGNYPTVLNRHVFESLAFHGQLALHVRVLDGRDPHHITEAAVQGGRPGAARGGRARPARRPASRPRRACSAGAMSKEVVVIGLIAVAGFLPGGVYSTWKTAPVLAIVLVHRGRRRGRGAVVWLMS